MSVFSKKLTRVPVLLSFVQLNLLYLCVCCWFPEGMCVGRNTQFVPEWNTAATTDEVKYHCRGSSNFWKTPVWPDVTFTVLLILLPSVWSVFFFFVFLFLVNFIIHLHSLPRILKANIFRADTGIAISSFWKYLFTTCCVVQHTGKTKMSKA